MPLHDPFFHFGRHSNWWMETKYITGRLTLR